MSQKLLGQICLVTGASKGIGRGIALQLGQAGATVYITGRSKDALDATCKEINDRGGKGRPIVMDHSNDQEVEDLFKRIDNEQNGKLDVLVNNAYAGVYTIMNAAGKPFWETDAVKTWDEINGVGLRNHYLCTVYGSRIMTKNRSGLIVTVSSPGGLKYLFNCAYGIGKAANDRMAADCGIELKKSNVAMVSLWPGPVMTEKIEESNQTIGDFSDAESVEFAGKAVVGLAADPNKMSKTAKIVLTADLAREYGFTDLDGVIHGDFRQIRWMLKKYGWTGLAGWVPEWVRVPHALLHFSSNKF